MNLKENFRIPKSFLIRLRQTSRWKKFKTRFYTSRRLQVEVLISNISWDIRSWKYIRDLLIQMFHRSFHCSLVAFHEYCQRRWSYLHDKELLQRFLIDFLVHLLHTIPVVHRTDHQIFLDDFRTFHVDERKVHSMYRIRTSSPALY